MFKMFNFKRLFVFTFLFLVSLVFVSSVIPALALPEPRGPITIIAQTQPPATDFPMTVQDLFAWLVSGGFAWLVSWAYDNWPWFAELESGQKTALVTAAATIIALLQYVFLNILAPQTRDTINHYFAIAVGIVVAVISMQIQHAVLGVPRERRNEEYLFEAEFEADDDGTG